MKRRRHFEEYISDWADRPSECWIWAGQKNWRGYGRVCRSRDGVTRDLSTHRLAFELLRGPIPVGMTLDHLCRNRACFNPAHLEPVTTKTNVLRGEGITAINARKTHCIHGHEFRPGNFVLQIRKDSTPKRRCMVCERERDRKRRSAA